MTNFEFPNIDSFRLVHFDEKEILKEHRIMLGLTQKAAAAKAGIPLNSYQNFECGNRKIRRASFQVVCQVLEALEMDIAGFFHGDYILEEEIFVKDGVRYYKKTGRPVDVEPSDEE